MADRPTLSPASTLRERERTLRTIAKRRASGDDVCGHLDFDGIDYCERPSQHPGGHYSYDPAGRISTRRPCLAGCGSTTGARGGVCAKCAVADPTYPLRQYTDPATTPPHERLLHAAREATADYDLAACGERLAYLLPGDPESEAPAGTVPTCGRCRDALLVVVRRG